MCIRIPAILVVAFHTLGVALVVMVSGTYEMKKWYLKIIQQSSSSRIGSFL